MIVLAFDTATPATVVGLALADGRIFEARDDPARGERPGHATRLLPLAASLLAKAGASWSDVERIAVGVGPGTFTGLRVGIATAHGLARSLGAPLVGVSSLRALARGVREDRRVLAAIDARRGEIFLAGYHGDVQLLAPTPLAPQAVAERLADSSAARPMVARSSSAPYGESAGWLAVGDGALRYRASLEAAGAEVLGDREDEHLIRARALCELAAAADEGAPTVLPEYLRRPDAEASLRGAAA